MIAAYMASEGQRHEFKLWWERSEADHKTIVPAFSSAQNKTMLIGDSLQESREYEWRSAGIIGRVIHETGKDEAH
ncbi:hypothetical protein [Rathayibacter agropyri]|uniref:hypothetical protein n=1 Tax=Rathayibacter agropyri TaxID=1634927 RepID=UPI00156527C5|nr:hypothetical protein [Rathayibacter agropyri]NRD09999.1 hypothetical protein [Rathayibacter agropyri]